MRLLLSGKALLSATIYKQWFFAIERANDVMNYMVKSYFAIDERSPGTWKEEGYFSSIDDAKNFINTKLEYLKNQLAKLCN